MASAIVALLLFSAAFASAEEPAFCADTEPGNVCDATSLLHLRHVVRSVKLPHLAGVEAEPAVDQAALLEERPASPAAPMEDAMSLTKKSATGASEEGVSVKFMQFNIRREPGDTTCGFCWGSEPYCALCGKKRRDAVAANIRAQNPDIVGTQEGQHHQIYQIAELLNHDYAYAGQGRRSPDDETSAIFYKRRDWDLVAVGDFMFSDEPHNMGSHYVEATYPMANTWAVLVRRQPPGSQRLLVVCVHMDPWSMTAREKSGNQLVSTIESLRARHQTEHMVVLGDFNAGPKEAPLQALSNAGFRDAYATTHGGTPYGHFTYHDWHGPDHKPTGNGVVECRRRVNTVSTARCSASDGDNPVDFVLTSPWTMHVTSADFDFNQYGGMWPSDHWALVAQVTIPPNPWKGSPGYEWRAVSRGNWLPSGAVQIRHAVYVGRLTPFGEAGEVRSRQGTVEKFVVTDYGEKTSAEVLVLRSGATVRWETVTRGTALPLGAVVTGWTYQDFAIYAARVNGGYGCKLNTGYDNKAHSFWCKSASRRRGHRSSGQVLVVTPSTTP